MKYLFLNILFILCIAESKSQVAPYVINQNHNGCCGGGANAGSSFKVFGAGQIDSIRIYPRHNQDYAATIKFFKGNGPNPDSLLYTESFSVFGTYSTPAGNDVKLIKLTTPLKVKKDSVYTFYVEGAPIRFSNGSNVYSDGSYYNLTGDEVIGSDADFMIYVGTVTTTSSFETLSNEVLIQLDNNNRVLNVSNSNKSFDLKLFNTNGILVSEGSKNQMNLPALSEGVYILQLNSNQDYFTRKIYIKQ